MDAATKTPVQPIPNPLNLTTQPVPNIVTMPNDPSSHSNKLKIIIFSFIAILILTLIGGTATYAIAYDKIKINNPALEKSITQFVQGMPFTPKTPKFLLNAAMSAHQKVSSFDFNISIAAKSDSLTSVLGSDKGDVNVQGFIDYKDPEKIALSLNGALSTDFNIDIRKKDYFFYLKINKIPLTILALAGIKDPSIIKPILENWVGIDTTPLNTEARKTLNEQEKKNITINEKVETELNKLMEEKILNAITVKSEDLDGAKTYKLEFKPDQSVWDFIDQRNNEEAKTADMFEKFILTVWIDQNDSLIKKVEVLADVKTDAPMSFISPLASTVNSNLSIVPGSKEKIVTSIAGVVKLSAYNEQKNVEVPGKYMSVEEFYSIFMNAMSGKKVSANDVTRQSHIEKIFQSLTACFQASSPHMYPRYLENLKGCGGTVEVPIDPSSGQPYEYKTNAARSKFSLKAKLDNGEYYEASETGIISNTSLSTTPTELTKRARDAARFTDLANLQQAINVTLYEAAPDASSLACQGVPGNPKTCFGSSVTDTRQSDGTGWIKVKLTQQKSVSIPTLPVDPKNDATYKYIYCANGSDWEIITMLESNQYYSKMASDGGSDPTKYEVGSNLNLLNKIPGCTY